MHVSVCKLIAICIVQQLVQPKGGSRNRKRQWNRESDTRVNNNRVIYKTKCGSSGVRQGTAIRLCTQEIRAYDYKIMKQFDYK